MNWRQYQNEFIVICAFLIMLGAYSYKSGQVSMQVDDAQSAKSSFGEIKEVLSLKKIWADKDIGKKVDNFKTIINNTKVKWSKNTKKVTANYTGLSGSELNTLTTAILKLPVQILVFKTEKTGSTYKVDFKCKW